MPKQIIIRVSYFCYFSAKRECRGNGCSLSADSEIPLGEPRVLLMRSCTLSKVLRG